MVYANKVTQKGGWSSQKDQPYDYRFRTFFFLIYDSHTETEREREAETQAEGEAGSMQGARRGIQSRVSRIAPWAKGKRQTAAPPRDPVNAPFNELVLFYDLEKKVE